ncbi:dihydroxyacetone kinase [Microbacterium sp. W4I4]|uniref:dihydroxyacetone kinase family protein n=1 Tax=Microbacterium sp. W4I4 TaxID=3042295 RepID=UPI0027861AE1|nr:dihydroxyacetone kinase family protein [Microbacterium sp. W4I4]MDQ0615355.1 dihydroxyacetone kinase [Microbacterium sp. W4I4]
MTWLFNNPEDFADEAIAGFTVASSRWVRSVSGGVVRATRGAKPTVAVVTGGGSGHYPAFGGLVGPGIAHGAAMGNVFASPSARQVESVAKAAHEGKGILLTFGNYTGDVLHFGRAQERLREDGIDCRTVVVTDDIWSAPPSDIDGRRGIAGDLVVFKIAGAAAESGADLDAVETVARKANTRTRSFGVAFGGCTLPGATEPLFTVPAGKMAVGLGIHGEPGISEVDIPSARALAELFVEKLLQEVPEGVDIQGARVVPLLNGLGSVKYEELYVVYKTIHELLETAGLVVVDPEVGELCTSFDMAGLSLTLLWMDEELEELWLAPCDTPAYRRGVIEGRNACMVLATPTDSASSESASSSSTSSRSAVIASRALAMMSEILNEKAEELGDLDRIAGDGDHGIGMQRGSRAAAAAAAAALAAGSGLRTTLSAAGDAWSDKGGGTSGAIWGEMLIALGTSLGETSSVTTDSLGAGLTAMKCAVMNFGKAKPGDKTMIDAIVPFVDEFNRRIADGNDLIEAWAQAAHTSTVAADSTAAMAARLGRARTHGDKSLGTPDPGAVSFALVTRTVLNVLKEDN